MKTYKITNTTNLVGRRDPKYNTIVDIEYIDNRIKKYNKLNAGETMFLTVSTLPLSIHRLRIKELITVEEIDADKLSNILKDTHPKVKENTKKPKGTKKPVILDKNNEFDEVSTKKSSSSKKSTSSKKSSSNKKSSTSTKKSSTTTSNESS